MNLIQGVNKPEVDPRQRILEAGLKLFANRGYAGTSVNDVAEEAGITKPTLYYYFESKQGLFQALVDQSMDERFEVMERAISPDKTVVEQLVEMIVQLVECAHRRKDLMRLCFAVAFAAKDEVPPGLKCMDKVKRNFEFIEELMSNGIRDGYFSDRFEPSELASSFWAHMNYCIVSELLSGRGPCRPAADPRQLMKIFMEGAGAKKERSTKSAGGGLARTLTILILLFSLNPFARGEIQSPESGSSAAASGQTAIPPTPVTSSVPATTPTPAIPVPLSAPGPGEAPPSRVALHSPLEASRGDSSAINLEECFRLAAVRSDTLKISEQGIRVAQTQFSQAVANLFPTISIVNSQNYQSNNGFGGGVSANPIQAQNASFLNGTGSNGFAINGPYSSSTQITLVQTIFNGFKNYNQVGANDAAIASQKYSLSRAYQTLYQNVAAAFYQILSNEGDLVILADEAKALEDRETELKLRVQLGRSRPAEQLQAQADLANAKVTIEQTRGLLGAAKELMAFYLGIPAKDIKLKETQKFPDSEQLETYLQRSGARPDILALVESERQARRNLSAAKGDLLPVVTLNGNVAITRDPPFNQDDWGFTLQIEMPLFDGGLILSRIREQKELVRTSELNVDELQRTADQDVRTALNNFNAGVAQAVQLREAALLSEENYNAQAQDYRRGVVSNLDVLNALKEFQDARRQLNSADMNARVNLINLHVAAGLAASEAPAVTAVMNTSGTSSGKNAHKP